ncbi:TRAP transporter small permease subunit [Mesorhizobium sp. CAU 1741]|uniref:TRAP transporter small permease n=1 Tax=Mesorhizobium sp. CAU 1741 TaxID=3140366 RepID=UPI00325B3E94
MQRVIDFLEGWIAYLILPGLAVLVAADVVLRYVLNLPLRWGNDVKELLLLLVVVGALPGVGLADQHIRVGLFDRFFRNRAGQIWVALRHVLTGLVALAIGYAVLLMALDMFRYGDRAEMIAISFWPFAGFVALTAGLSALAEFVRASRAVRGDD